MITELEGIPASEQLLLCGDDLESGGGGMRMEAGMLMEDYGIHKESSLRLVPDRGPKLHAAQLATRKAMEELGAMQSSLSRRWEELRVAEAELESSKRALARRHGGAKLKDRLKLTVGGQHINTTRSALSAFPESKLAALFSGRWESRLLRDPKDTKRVFLDCSPEVFTKLVEFCMAHQDRSGGGPVELPDCAPELKGAFHHTLRWFGLEELFQDESLPPGTMSAAKADKLFARADIRNQGVLPTKDFRQLLVSRADRELAEALQSSDDDPVSKLIESVGGSAGAGVTRATFRRILQSEGDFAELVASALDEYVGAESEDDDLFEEGVPPAAAEPEPEAEGVCPEEVEEVITREGDIARLPSRAIRHIVSAEYGSLDQADKTVDVTSIVAGNVDSEGGLEMAVNTMTMGAEPIPAPAIPAPAPAPRPVAGTWYVTGAGSARANGQYRPIDLPTCEGLSPPVFVLLLLTVRVRDQQTQACSPIEMRTASRCFAGTDATGCLAISEAISVISKSVAGSTQSRRAATSLLGTVGNGAPAKDLRQTSQTLQLRRRVHRLRRGKTACEFGTQPPLAGSASPRSSSSRRRSPRRRPRGRRCVRLQQPTKLERGALRPRKSG